MGININKETFTSEDFSLFRGRLDDSLEALKRAMQRPSFGYSSNPLIGAELENYIVDEHGNVMPINQQLIAASDDKDFTVELNRFNLEINFAPIAISPDCFSQLGLAMNTKLTELESVAQSHNAHVVPIGILPTLREQHLTPEYMTDLVRYRALSKSLLAMRGEHFKVNISGKDQLQMACDHVGLEGANTSFQFHLMIPTDQFANYFNAVQMTNSLVLAVGANSPIFMGKQLWDETRVALFKQSIDSRLREQVQWRQPSRVSFGHGWVRRNAWELFAEAVSLYPPLFPILSEHDPLDQVRNDRVPSLEELCLHVGTIWPWNRAVYSNQGNGHIRIEMRSLPAGPTVKDMVANAAFACGLAYGLQDTINDWLTTMPFRFAEYNFYRAAQSGLDASIVWPCHNTHKAVEKPIKEVIEALLPTAEKGLTIMGISEQQAKLWLDIIAERVRSHTTGAIWQKQVLSELEQTHNRDEACGKMFNAYRNFQQSSVPVTEWPKAAELLKTQVVCS